MDGSSNSAYLFFSVVKNQWDVTEKTSCLPFPTACTSRRVQKTSHATIIHFLPVPAENAHSVQPLNNKLIESFCTVHVPNQMVVEPKVMTTKIHKTFAAADAAGGRHKEQRTRERTHHQLLRPTDSFDFGLGLSVCDGRRKRKKCDGLFV